MKKLILIAVLMLISFGIKAQTGNEYDCYIKAGDKVYIGTDLKMGLIHSKIKLPDGTVKEIYNRDITALRNHDKLYMMMPVICDKSDTLCMALMEYIKSSSDYDVFLYCCYDMVDHAYRLDNVYKNVFFVYKDGKYYRRLNEDQTEDLSDYGIKVLALK